MSRHPPPQNFNMASLNSVMGLIYIDIIGEGANRNESLMSGELDLASPPPDITLNYLKKKTIQCSV